MDPVFGDNLRKYSRQDRNRFFTHGGIETKYTINVNLLDWTYVRHESKYDIPTNVRSHFYFMVDRLENTLVYESRIFGDDKYFTLREIIDVLYLCFKFAEQYPDKYYVYGHSFNDLFIANFIYDELKHQIDWTIDT